MNGQSDNATPGAGNRSPKRWIFHGLRFLVTFLAIYFLFATDRLKWSEFRLAAGGRRDGLAAVACLYGAMFLTYVRHWVLLRASGETVPLVSAVKAGLVSWFLNATLLGGLGFASGDAVRVGWLLPSVKSRSSLVSATVIDRVMGFCALCVVALAAVFGVRVAVAHGGQYSGALTAAVVSAAALPIAVALFGRVLRFLNRGEGWKCLLREKVPFGGALARLGEAILRVHAKPVELGKALVLGVLSQTLLAVCVFLVSRALVLEVQPHFREVFFAAPLTGVIGVMPLPANGLGVGEAAFDTLLKLARSETEPLLQGGAMIYLAFRVLTLLSGILGLPFFLRGRDRLVGVSDNPAISDSDA